MTVRELADRIAKGDAALSLTRGLPVVGPDGQLEGIETQGDLLRALQADPTGQMTVLDAGSRSLIVTYADERAFDALFRMLQNNVGRLPVVRRENPKQLVGYLNRSSVLNAWTRQFEEVSVREGGWLGRFLKGSRVDKQILIGKVVSVDDSVLKLDCAAEGNVLTMAFELQQPLAGITLGDHVKVTYRSEDGQNILEGIEELRAH